MYRARTPTPEKIERKKTLESSFITADVGIAQHLTDKIKKIQGITVLSLEEPSPSQFLKVKIFFSRHLESIM